MSQGDTPTAKVAVWTFLIPDQAMAYPVLTSRDSKMRIQHRIYFTLPPPDDHPDNRLLGDLSLSLHLLRQAPRSPTLIPSSPVTTFSHGIPGKLSYPSRRPPKPSRHLGPPNCPPCPHGELRGRAPAPRRFPRSAVCLVDSGHQHLPLTGIAELEPGDIPRLPRTPFLHAYLSLLYNVILTSGRRPPC